tara:strand:- start:33 stop:839 length:807 start_codon:yes stop_codon:yes gene_type:complete
MSATQFNMTGNGIFSGYASVNALASPDGTSIVFPANTGYVGIGTGSTAPASRLHVLGNSNLAASLTLHNTAPSTDNIWRITPFYNSGDLGFLDDGTERMRIDSDGVAHFNGDVKVLSGDIQMGSGRGINFSASSNAGGMTSETLDDYEEGTWTASLSGVASQTLGNNVGYYTKIGHRVFFQWYSSNSTIGTANGPAVIAGLPFTASSAGASYGLFQYLHGTGVLNSTGGYVNLNNTNMIFISENSTSASNFSAGSGKYIMIQGSYSVA